MSVGLEVGLLVANNKGHMDASGRRTDFDAAVDPVALKGRSVREYLVDGERVSGVATRAARVGCYEILHVSLSLLHPPSADKIAAGRGRRLDAQVHVQVTPLLGGRVAQFHLHVAKDALSLTDRDCNVGTHLEFDLVRCSRT